jgi:hypothetical protein
LELQDASEEAAALAVLQSMYAVAPLQQLLAPLGHDQLLQAAVLADKWQVPDVSTRALRVLQENFPPSTELIHKFLQLPAVPTFLLPLFGSVMRACIGNKGKGAIESVAGMAEGAKRLLLSVLGDMEEVMGDAALKRALLALPLHAVELLLSSDDLKVCLLLGVNYASHIVNDCDARACPCISVWLLWYECYVSAVVIQIDCGQITCACMPVAHPPVGMAAPSTPPLDLTSR